MSRPAAFAQYSPPGGFANDFEQTPLISENVYLRLLPGGPMTNNLPISEVPATFGGRRQPGYADDLLYRIHVTPGSFNLGNVAGTTTRTISVWNALAFDVTLNAITPTNADGTSITGHAGPPLSFGPLQDRDYTLTVTQQGPASIDASWLFGFSEGSGRTVRAFGNRAITWTWAPDWGQPITERLEWRTEVLRSFNGREQRRRLRQGARRIVEMPTLMTDADRQRLEIAIFGWGARSWAVPVWWDGQALTVQVTAAATSISASTTNREFVAGGYAVITNGYTLNEIVEVLSFTASTITTVRPVAATWPAGSMLYPAIIAQLDPAISIERFTSAASLLRARFTALAPADVTAGSLTLYLGYPVLDSRPLLASSMTATYTRKLEDIDNDTGFPFRDDEAGIPILGQTHGWLAQNRAEKGAIRALLYRLSGRFGAVWIPTMASDVTVAVDIGNLAVNIDISNQKYALFAAAVVGRNHLRLQRRNGTVTYHKISGATEISASIERLTLTPAITPALAAADVVQASFMALHRQSADAVEIGHFTGEAFEVTASFTGFRHDL